jgi:hypothetical protein
VIENVRGDHEVVVTFVKIAADWYLAEGSTAGGMETWVLVQNPNDHPVTVDLTLMTGSGLENPPELQQVHVPADSRINFNLNAFLATYHVSTMVTSEGGDVVCERAVYGAGRTWGTGSVGATAPAPVWYLAEGSTGGGMQTWILVQNPNDAPVTVDVDYMTPDGLVPGPQDFHIPAHTRVNFSVMDSFTGYEVSTMVTSSGGGVVCERSMYGSGGAWAHVSVGHAE